MVSPELKPAFWAGLSFSTIPGVPGLADAKLLEETSACLKALQKPENKDDWETVKRNARAAYESALKSIVMN